jgi:hypothetical protein
MAEREEVRSTVVVVDAFQESEGLVEEERQGQ